MKKVGFVGWRGMVGSVLLSRMVEENDFENIRDAVFFSTSNVGGEAPNLGQKEIYLRDANDLTSLAQMEILVTCQGGAYTKAVHQKLRDRGWKGFWLDAASPLRTSAGAMLVLDPVNHSLIKRAIDRGVKDFVGGNCTVSLMLMALTGLFRADLIEWVSSMTYQSASGAGAQSMKELLLDMQGVSDRVKGLLQDPAAGILEIDRQVTNFLRSEDFSLRKARFPLVANLLPWVDDDLGNGQSREEWKGMMETNKLLGLPPKTVKVDGLCVRIGAMRCHSQALTIKLKEDIPVKEIEKLLHKAHQWVHVVPNEKEATLRELTPAAVAGTLTIPIGRIKKANFGAAYLTAFTVGDQLLWGAAEPIRRMLSLILGLNP
ncbi:MAG: aspartate-semialdehyde dehydrogenase [Neisseriaceae bacterium]